MDCAQIGGRRASISNGENDDDELEHNREHPSDNATLTADESSNVSSHSQFRIIV